ncbi:MAG: hypothetical protein ACREGH_00350, partial [Minisyncoccia bacterium]
MHTRLFIFVSSAFAFVIGAALLIPMTASADQIDYAPSVPQPTQSGDIVGLDLQNTGGTTEAAGYVTFGEVFQDGDVEPSDSLVARIGGTNYPVQMDVKATNSDGSVRHAILTFEAPAIAPSAAVGVMLAKGIVAFPSTQA